MARNSLNTSLKTRSSKKTKGSRNDRVSSLPDHLLSEMLSKLPTKESVRTSVLSKEWKHIWSSVPALYLDFHDFKNEFELMESIDRFLKSNKWVDRFKLIYDVTIEEHDHEYFVPRIDGVVKRKVCHLTILNKVDVDEALVRMPLSLYSCATLVDLTLFFVVFDHPGSELVSLPCVKNMYLEGIKFDGDWILETLIAKSPILENLTIVTHSDDYLGEVVCVRSHSLKIFKLESQRPEGEEEDPDVEIDAPKLESMIVCGYQPKSFVIHRIAPFAKVHMDIVFDVEYDDPSEITMLRNFLIGLSTVSEMTISAGTLKVIHDYSEVESLPQFSNLSRLEALLAESSWEVLPAFLGCCMNLHSLIVELDSFPNIEEIKLSPVPQCVISSLDFLQLKTPASSSLSVKASKMKLATYFKKNFAGLKKLVL